MKDGIETGIKELKNSITSGFQNLQSQYSASIEKLKFYYMNPGELTSELLTNLLGKEVHIEFKLLKEIRSRIVSFFQMFNDAIKNGINKDSNQEEGIAVFSSNSNNHKSDNNDLGLAVVEIIIAIIELQWLDDALKVIGSSLQKLADISFNALQEFCLIFTTTLNSIFDYFKQSFLLDSLIAGESEYLKIGEKMASEGEQLVNAKGVGKGFAGLLSIFNLILDIDEAGSGISSKTEDYVMAVISFATNIISIFLPFGFGLIVSGLGDLVPQIIVLRKHGYIIPI